MMQVLGFAVLIAMLVMPVMFIIFQVLMMILCKLIPSFEVWANAHLLEED